MQVLSSVGTPDTHPRARHSALVSLARGGGILLWQAFAPRPPACFQTIELAWMESMRSKPGRPHDHAARTSCAQANSRAWRFRQGMHGAHSLGLPATVKSFLHRRHFGPVWPSMSRGCSTPDHKRPESGPPIDMLREEFSTVRIESRLPSSAPYAKKRAEARFLFPPTVVTCSPARPRC